MHEVNEPVDGLTIPQRWRGRPWLAGLMSRSRPIVLVCAFLIFTVAMMWPLPLHAGSAVQDLGDPLYEIWTMRWVQHQLVTDPAHLWDGNTGYPFADSLLFSEPRISTSVIAWPIQIVSGNDVLSYNLMLMGSYFLVGIGVALLIQELTGETGAAVLAGFVSAFVPYRFGHLSHLNLLSYGWGLMALWSLARFARRRRPLDAILSAVFLAIQVLASDTLGVMAGLIVGCAIVVLLWQERRRLSLGLFAGLAAVVALPALAELPAALARLRVDREYGFSRSLATVSEMSATLQSYGSISPGSPFWRAVQILPSAYPNPLFPGVIASLAAIAGLGLGMRFWPRWTIYAAVIALAGFVLSLGPYTVTGGQRYRLPYYFLYVYLPGFDAMRDVARFGMVTLIGVEILAGLGLAALWKLLRNRLPERRVLLVGTALVAVLLIGAAVELRVTVRTVTVPKDTNSTAVYDWLATQPRAPVMEFPANGLWTNIGWSIREIYFSTRHWDPIVAAYTSFIPQRDIEMLVAIHGGTTTPSLVNATNVGMLQDLGIHYVVIHRWPGYDWTSALDQAATLPQLTRVGDFGDATVFTLARGSRLPVVQRIVAPQSAEAGRPVVVDVVTRNDNPTPAINWLKLDPSVTITWKSSTGSTVASVRLPIHLNVSAAPGLTIDPLTLTAPVEAGAYQLTIDCPGLAAAVSQTVSVSAPRPAVNTGSEPELTLRRLSLPPGPYRPGDWMEITAEWVVRRQPQKDLTATIQLIDDQNRPFSQWDGQPFGMALPTSQWRTGSVISQPLLVRIPPNTRATQFRAMIALYDYSSPSLERAMIEGPDGTTAPQFITGVMNISPSH